MSKLGLQYSGIVIELAAKQKMAIRNINNVAYNAHTESLFKSLSILPLPLLSDYFKLQFIYLFSFNHLRASFNNMWIKNSERRGDIGDERDDYYVPFACLSSIVNNPLVYVPKLLNKFTDPCKSTSSRSLFNP